MRDRESAFMSEKYFYVSIVPYFSELFYRGMVTAFATATDPSLRTY